MGIYAGFDLHPPLQDTVGDNMLYADFLAVVHHTFKDDPVMTINERGDTVFRQGEEIVLEKEGFRFRRFSAKISGRACKHAEYYLADVRMIAVRCFGEERVHYWNELYDTYGVYSWTEVYAAAEVL